MTPQHEGLAADRCAVVVVDLQNDFCHDRGGMAQMGQDVTRAQESIPHVQQLIDAAHDTEVPVILVRTEHSEWFDTPAWVSRGRGGEAIDVGRVPLVREGTWGAEFYGVAPAPEDLVITKHRFSGFAYTPLELALRARRRDTVVLAGTVTHVCVEATGLDALMRGFFPVLVAECASAASALADEAARDEFAHHIGVVVPLSDITGAWAMSKPITDVGRSTA